MVEPIKFLLAANPVISTEFGFKVVLTFRGSTTVRVPPVKFTTEVPTKLTICVPSGTLIAPFCGSTFIFPPDIVKFERLSDVSLPKMFIVPLVNSSVALPGI